MSNTAIRVDNLSKLYQLGAGLPQHGLRELIQQRAEDIWGGLTGRGERRGSLPGGSKEDFWALKDVSFEVTRGEVVGVIGRNGAGKSTLLKILSRITEPTSGRVEIHGRVGSLLEVGTGFHPELTGRENIFLNGAILGMSQSEIRSKLEAIVEFSGIGRFLETPVKRYSSGMYVRLAFAVAAHLQPEILIVDEVLAVGDAEFQKKCLGKMQDVAEAGRTVLFVSHNLAAIQSLCSRAVLLEGGELSQEGEPAAVIGSYLKKNWQLAERELAGRTDRTGSGKIRFASVEYLNARGGRQEGLQTGQTGIISLQIANSFHEDQQAIEINIGVSDEQGVRVCLLSTSMSDSSTGRIPATGGVVRFELPKVPLVAGRYSLTLYATVQNEVADWVIDAAVMDVVEGDFFGTGRTPPVGQGKVLVPHRVSFHSPEVVG